MSLSVDVGCVPVLQAVAWLLDRYRDHSLCHTHSINLCLSTLIRTYSLSFSYSFTHRTSNSTLNRSLSQTVFREHCTLAPASTSIRELGVRSPLLAVIFLSVWLPWLLPAQPQSEGSYHNACIPAPIHIRTHTHTHTYTYIMLSDTRAPVCSLSLVLSYSF